MRKRLIILLLLLVIMMPVSMSAAPIPEAKKTVYKIGGDENFPPYEFVESSEGKSIYRGFNVDIMKAVALQTGLEFEFKPLTWIEAVKALDNGELDAIQGMKYDKFRATKYDFSEEYIISAQIVFVLKDTYATELNELRGYKIAVQEGDIAFERLRKDKSFDLVLAPNQEEAFKLLLSGQVKAVVGNKLAGQYILQKNRQLDKVKMIGPDIDPQKYGVAVRKGNEELLSVINNGIREIKRNGTYDKIYRKWFGEPVDYPPVYYKGQIMMLLKILGVLAFFLAVLMYISYVLRREVKKRTRKIEAINKELLEMNEYIRKEDSYKEKILNSGYSGIVTMDNNGYIQFINNYAARYLDYSGPVGKHYTETPVKSFFPNGTPATEEQKDKVMGGELEINGMQMEYNYHLLTEDGKVVGIVLNFRDITTEKHLREQVIRKDKMEAVGNLAAGIAHEIRTPLTSIKTFAELLPEKYNNPSFREKISLFVPQEVERISSLVNQLLDYAQPRKPYQEKIKVRALIENALVLLENNLKNHNIRVINNIGTGVTVYADKQQLLQVFINVFLNAFEAMNYVKEPHVLLSCEEGEGQVTIVFEDNGTGMEEEVIKRIFEPFFTTKATGTGLGLAVSYQLVIENGGGAWVESTPNIGTKVFIRLPQGRLDE